MYILLFVFADQWKHHGMVTSTGKPVIHGKLLLKLLQAILPPIQLAVCKCYAHTNAKDIVSTGNAFADKTEKKQLNNLLMSLN